MIEIEKLQLHTDMESIDLLPMVQANVCAHHGDAYFFETEDPQIYFGELSIDMLAGAKSLFVQLRYAHMGKDALHVCANQIMTDKNYQAKQQTQTIEQQTQTIEQQTERSGSDNT